MLESHQEEASQESGLPEQLRPLFWQHDFEELSWEQDRDLVIGRTLSHGSWDDIQWLRSRLTNAELREWIVRRRGRMLSPRQLRFWELILGIPRATVTRWLDRPERKIWDQRART